MIIARFLPFFRSSVFMIKKSYSKSTAEKVRFGSSLRGGVVGGSVGASSFGWFLGGFGWFLLVESDFRWFQGLCCFSSYINFTGYRAINSLLIVAHD